MRITILLLLASLASAGDERVTLDFKNEHAMKIVKVLNMYSGAKIKLDAEYRDKTVTMRLSNSTAEKAYAELARVLGGAAWKERKGVWHIAPKWSIALRKKMTTTKLDAVVGGPSTLGNSLLALRLMSGINIVADPKLDLSKKIAPITDAGTVQKVLEKMCEKAGCVWSLRWGVVYLASKERLAGMPHTPPIPMTGRLVALPFRKTTLAQVVNYFVAASGQQIVLEKSVDAKTKISVETQAIDFAQALALTLYPIGRQASMKEKVITIS